ncbi:MAG: sigma factor-like helix-turn-helix DNA-binding protein [Prevotellaceae bacterium]|nr:sigma factor-like helix-turn-helix DNA-binding protein [Prevotellaceae bacterium]
MERLAPATRRVYALTRDDAMTIEDIANTLSISRRTVECHQFRARKYVREEFRKII